MYTKTLFAAALGLLLACQPASASGQHRIEGVWDAQVTLRNCLTGDPLPFPGATFDALALYEHDGSFLDTNEDSPLTRSPAFGTWEHVGGRVYKFAFKHFRFDTTGTLPTGSVIVRHRVVLAPNGNRYSSKGTAEFYDVSGIRVLPDGCSTSTAQRFK